MLSHGNVLLASSSRHPAPSMLIFEWSCQPHGHCGLWYPLLKGGPFLPRTGTRWEPHLTSHTLLVYPPYWGSSACLPVDSWNLWVSSSLLLGAVTPAQPSPPYEHHPWEKPPGCLTVSTFRRSPYMLTLDGYLTPGT